MKRSDASGTSVNHTFQSRNPHFGTVDRGPYILGHLLGELPPAKSAITSETYLQAQAAAQHAENGIRTLTHGFKSIGTLMMFTGMSDEEYEPGDLMNLGELLSYLSVELQLLQELRENLQHEVREFEKSEGRAQ